MKKKSSSQSAFFNLRVLIGLFVFLAGVSLALVGSGVFFIGLPRDEEREWRECRSVLQFHLLDRAGAQAQRPKQAQPRSGPPDVVQMVGPVALNQDLRTLPYIPQEKEGAGPVAADAHPARQRGSTTATGHFLSLVEFGDQRNVPAGPQYAAAAADV